MADTTKRLPRTVCSIAKDRKQLPIEEKESLRWLDTHAQEIAQQYPETNMVAVADSEADIFEVIEADKDSPENFQWIIRGCYDRSTMALTARCFCKKKREGRNRKETPRFEN